MKYSKYIAFTTFNELKYCLVRLIYHYRFLSVDTDFTLEVFTSLRLIQMLTSLVVNMNLIIFELSDSSEEEQRF